MFKDLFSIKRSHILPGFLVILLALAVFFVSQIVTVVLIIIILTLAGQSEEQIESVFGAASYWPKLFALTLIAGAMVGLVFWVLRLWREKKVFDFLLLKKLPSPYQLVEVFATYGIYFMTLLVAAVLLSSTGIVDTNQVQEIGIDSPGTNSNLLAVFLMIVVLPPISEEILFRGFLYNKLSKYSSVGVSYVLTSVLFGIAHLEYGNLNWIAAVDTMLFSGFLIYISQRHQSLYSAMLMHALKNGIAFMILFR